MNERKYRKAFYLAFICFLRLFNKELNSVDGCIGIYLDAILIKNKISTIPIKKKVIQFSRITFLISLYFRIFD